MTDKPQVKHHNFIYRFYTLIVFGLIVIAAILDYGFGLYQDSFPKNTGHWIQSNFLLIEETLSRTPVDEWPEVLNTLETDSGLIVTVTQSDLIVGQANQELLDNEQINMVEDQDHVVSYFYHSKKLNAAIQIIDPENKSPKDTGIIRLIPALFYLSILILVGIWFRPLLRDIESLTKSTQEFAEDYRKPLSNLKNNSSLKALSTSFETMATKIRESIQDQKDFTNALSHELRTPLARMKFGLAVLDKDDDQAFKDEVRSIGEDVTELDSIISHMLDYAKLDYLQTDLHWQAISVSEWMEVNSKLTKSNSIQLHIKNSSNTQHVYLDPYLMGLAISNLITNAERYAKTKIHFSFISKHEKQAFIIEDDGEGIPENMRNVVLTAFKRLDTESNKNTTGFGLGLAIVARIAALHGGTISIEDSQLGGAKFILSWNTPEKLS